MNFRQRHWNEACKRCAAQRLLQEHLRNAGQVMFQDHRLTGALSLQPRQHFDAYAN